MDIRSIYEIQHPIGVGGASSPRQYIDLRGKYNKSLPIKTKKRETFVAEIQKIAKGIPGPGKYEINPEDKKYAKKAYKKIDFKVQSKKSKKDFIEQILKQKKGIPGVGIYELENKNQEKIKQWYSVLGQKLKKKSTSFKPTIFDDVHVDLINVGPGYYHKETSLVKMNKFKPQQPISNNQEQKIPRKRNNSLPQLPSSQTYRPIPAEFDTFDKLLSEKKKPSQTNLAKQKRFSLEKQIGPGPKYSLIAEWSPKNQHMSKLKSKGANIFKSTSNLHSPSIYY